MYSSFHPRYPQLIACRQDRRFAWHCSDARMRRDCDCNCVTESRWLWTCYFLPTVRDVLLITLEEHTFASQVREGTVLTFN